MKKSYIINEIVLYIPNEHRLLPLGGRGKEIVLNAPVSRCLLLLLQHSGSIVNQRELFGEVWEKYGQYVTASTLYQNVSLLRKGLRDAGLAQRTIKTVPKVGFVFIGQVQLVEEDKGGVSQNAPVHTEITRLETTSEENPSLVNTPQKQKAASKNEKGNRKLSQVWLLIGFIKTYHWIFFIFCFVLLINSSTEKDRFFNTHNKIANINQCSVYVDRSDLLSNSQGYINYLKAKNVVCDDEQFIYITRATIENKVLVLFCDNNLQGDIRCSTRFTMTK